MPATKVYIENLFNTLKQFQLSGNWENSNNLIWQNADQIRNYLYSFKINGADNCFIKSYVDDALARFFHTIDIIARQKKEGKLLEIGSNPYLLTILVKKIFNYDITLTNYFDISIYGSHVKKGIQIIKSEQYDEQFEFEFFDLNIELSKLPFEENEFDMVLFCEVLEHIIVNPLNIFSRLKNLLKKNGILLITTPNAVRLINFAHMIKGYNFFDRYHVNNGVYGRHNREFTITEIEKILIENKLKVIYSETLDRYNYNETSMFVDSYDSQVRLPFTRDSLIECLKAINGEVSNRGDNIYVVALND
jgi:SAM-dependent methyltransferase